MSPALKEKLERLEAENRALREGQGDETALAVRNPSVFLYSQ